jgi:hypothetical protein
MACAGRAGHHHARRRHVRHAAGNTTLKQLVPNINYEAALHVLQDHMIELEGDLPELVLYRMSDGRDLSGRAVRLMLQPAIKRVEEARGNAESALMRADQMALTMGQNAGLWGHRQRTMRATSSTASSSAT